VPSVVPPPPPEARPTYDVVTHLSPASRGAIQKLVLAVAAKVAAEVVLALAGWSWSLHSPIGPFQTYRLGFFIWGLAAIAPHLILMYALLRHPGRRAFAYSLVIPSLQMFFGLFGRSASFVYILRTEYAAAATLFSIIPWFLNIPIIYFAWKAIDRTGIRPNPQRLIVAAFVIFLYSTMLPGLFFYLTYTLR
jgi:hypothetical protein